MINNDMRVAFRCDELLKNQLNELLENEKKRAEHNGSATPTLADVMRMAIKEKYARDISGEESDTYVQMLKNQFELTVKAMLDEQKLLIARYMEKGISNSKFEYDSLVKYLDLVLLTSGFKPDDVAFFKDAISRKCIFKDLIEEDLIEQNHKTTK